MNRAPIVILVGGSGTGKTQFFRTFTHSYYSFPSTSSYGAPAHTGILLVDTPGNPKYRNPTEYSWDSPGIFSMADLLVNFGDWKPEEIAGHSRHLRIIDHKGNAQETMNRILHTLQG